MNDWLNYNNLLSGGSGGGGFTPKSIPNLQVWVDPSDESTLTTVMGTTFMEVESLVDKSDNAFVFSAISAARRPTLQSFVNGHQVLSYSAAGFSKILGTTTSLTSGSVFSNSNGITVVGLVRRASSPSSMGVFSIGSSAVVRKYYATLLTTSTNLSLRFLPISTVQYPPERANLQTFALNVDYIVTLRIDLINYKARIKYNTNIGNELNISPTGLPDTGDMSGEIYFGEYDTNGLTKFIGNLGESVWYNRALIPEEITEIETYFSEKYNIPV